MITEWRKRDEVMHSTKRTTVRMFGSKNKPGSPIDCHPGSLIQPSAKHHTIAKREVTVTSPAVMDSAWSGSLFIIFSDMNCKKQETAITQLMRKSCTSRHNRRRFNLRIRCRSLQLVITTAHHLFPSEICFQIEAHQIIPTMPLRLSTEMQPTHFYRANKSRIVSKTMPKWYLTQQRSIFATYHPSLRHFFDSHGLFVH